MILMGRFDADHPRHPGKVFVVADTLDESVIDHERGLVGICFDPDFAEMLVPMIAETCAIDLADLNW